MPKLNATHLFVSPSLASILAVLFGSIAILLVFNLPFITESGVIGDIFLGESQSTDLQNIADQTVFEFSELTLENSILNNLAFFMFWALIGLVVFVSISTLGHTIAKISETIETARYLNQRKKHIDENLFIRLAIRLIGAFGFTVFYIIFAKFMVPFGVLSNRAWLGDIQSPSGWFYGALGFIVLALSLHIFIIFTRLATLKPRLFGGWEAIN